MRCVRATTVAVETNKLTYYKCVFVSFGIQHGMLIRHIVLCGPPGYTILSHFTPQTARISKQVTEHKTCVLIFSTTFVWNISHSKKNSSSYDQKCVLGFRWLLLSDLINAGIFSAGSNITFPENPSRENRVVLRRQTDGRVEANIRSWQLYGCLPSNPPPPPPPQKK